METVELPESLTGISDSAFYDCTGLKEIQLPENITTIGNNAFYNCKNLETIRIPDSVTNVGSGAFYCCNNLETIQIPNSVTSIGNRAFYQCTSLKSIELPAELTSIGSNTFYYCNQLKSVTFRGKKLTSIGYKAFQQCSSLTGIELPEGLQEVGSEAFYSCTALQQVKLPRSVTKIGTDAFRGSEITELQVLADALTDKSLTGCSKLEEITLFGGNLTTKVMAETALNHLILAGDPGTVAEDALLANQTKRNLQVTVTKDVSALSETFWKAAEKRGLESLTFQGEGEIQLSGLSFCGLSPYKELKDGTYFVDADGNLWLLDTENLKASLALAAANQTSVQIPGTVNGDYSVTGVRSNSFVLCKELESVTFEKPGQVEEIGAYAFRGRKKLTSINGKQKVSEINTLFAAGAVIGMDAYWNTGLTGTEPEYEVTKGTTDLRGPW